MDNEFGTIIKKQRLQLGLTLKDIAKAVNVTEATVQRWESGNIKNVRRDKINKLARVLQCSPNLLIDYDDDSFINSKILQDGIDLLENYGYAVDTFDDDNGCGTQYVIEKDGFPSAGPISEWEFISDCEFLLQKLKTNARMTNVINLTLGFTTAPKTDVIFPIQIEDFPTLEEITDGQPVIDCDGEELYTEMGTEIQIDFCLHCEGNSMVNARIQDGDIVFVKRQPMVKNGEIAVIAIDNEIMLRRVYYYPQTGKFILNAENSSYEPLIYTNEELNQVRILGKAVAFQSNVK